MNVLLSVVYGITSLVVIFMLLEENVLSQEGDTGHLILSGTVLFGLFIIVANLRLLVMSTGVRAILVIFIIVCVAVYWPSEILEAVVLAPTEESVIG